MVNLENMGETTTKDERSRVKIELPRGYGEVDQAGCKVEELRVRVALRKFVGCVRRRRGMRRRRTRI